MPLAEDSESYRFGKVRTFSIDGLQFADSTQFLIAALNHKGKTSNMDLEISEPDKPAIPLPEYRIKELELLSDEISSGSRASHLRYQYMMNLPDLEVSGRKRRSQ